MMGCLGSIARADQVLLANGDRISGTITGLTADTLKIKTDYAGTLSLDTSAVQSFRTDQPAVWQINLKDHTAVIHSSHKPGHIHIEGKDIAIRELTLNPIQRTWKKSGLLETSLDVDNDAQNKEKLKVDAELNLESRHWRHKITAQSRRDKQRNRVTEDTFESGYTLDYLFSPQWLLRADGSYREEGVDIDSQYWYLSAGPGYRLWGESKNKLDAIIAYNRFWLKAGALEWELSAWSFALDYKQFWLGEKLETFSDFRIAIPTIEAIDYIANSSSGLRYYFGHNIHISIKYDHNETRYSLGSIKDSSYVLGAGVNF